MSTLTTNASGTTAEAAEALAPPIGAAGDSRHDLAIRAGQVAIGAAILAAWHLVSGRLIDPFFISSPAAVAIKLWNWSIDGTLWHAFTYTFKAMIIGFLIGSSAGFVTGFVLGRSDILARLFDPFITAIYCMPKIALAPLLILWFGIGIESKVAMSALIVFFLAVCKTKQCNQARTKQPECSRNGNSVQIARQTHIQCIVIYNKIEILMPAYNVITCQWIINTIIQRSSKWPQRRVKAVCQVSNPCTQTGEINCYGIAIYITTGWRRNAGRAC